MDDLTETLQQQEIVYDICATDDGAVECICWTSLTQLSLLKQFGLVLMLDGT